MTVTADILPDLRATLIAKTLRVPADTPVPAAGAAGHAIAHQIDAALLSAGFACSNDLLDHLASLPAYTAQETGETILRAVRELVGDHVQHNSYFIDFPDNIPDTLEFWAQLMAETLEDVDGAAETFLADLESGALNLLSLTGYGRYQHTYDELIAAREPFIASVKDPVTVLELGATAAEESHRLYLQLATSPAALNAQDLQLLAQLADIHIDDAQPETVDVRENRAIINRVRLAHDLPLIVDTPTDVLRLACALADGDVTLTVPTKLLSLRRSQRRRLLAALDAVVAAAPGKLADVTKHREQFKRLGERLHPHDYPQYPHALEVFAVARGEQAARSLAAQAEIAFAAGDTAAALDALRRAPGMLLRAVDRLARNGTDPAELAAAVQDASASASTRVLVQLREHLMNRGSADPARLFVNQQGRAWTAPDERDPLDTTISEALIRALDGALAARLAPQGRLVVAPEARALAVPVSDKHRPNGIGVLPRGSKLPVDNLARFFVYWRQLERRTDYDLSVLLLDDDFRSVGQVSFTNLRELGVVHSGDITEAPGGATEFIDLDLGNVRARYVVPQVNVYSGESFDDVEETFFGYMTRDGDQRGRPFEPRSVRAKSDLFGTGRIALPLIFSRDDAGWTATWMHLNLRGYPNFNRVETNRVSTSQLVQAIAGRRYLTIGDLADILNDRGVQVTDTLGDAADGEPVTYVALDRPENLPPTVTVFTPANLTELLHTT